MADTGDASKKDDGKLRYDLIPPHALELLAEVYTIGAAKYADNGWLTPPMRWGRIYRAMIGHAVEFWRGESRDEVDGQHHLASVAWCAFALMEYERLRIGEDDRPQGAASELICSCEYCKDAQHLTASCSCGHKRWKHQLPDFEERNHQPWYRGFCYVPGCKCLKYEAEAEAEAEAEGGPDVHTHSYQI
jgi:hypothetical protein